MAEKKLTFRAYTPDNLVLEQEVDLVVLRGSEGELGILPGHEDCAVQIVDGVIRLFENNKPAGVLMALGGFATVENNRVTVLSPVAERPENIEELLRSLKRRKAEREAQEQRSALEIHRVETALRNLLVQHDVSAYTVLQSRGEEGGKPNADQPR